MIPPFAATIRSVLWSMFSIPIFEFGVVMPSFEESFNQFALSGDHLVQSITLPALHQGTIPRVVAVTEFLVLAWNRLA